MKQSLDFIVIGAQKSGTTTLFEYLRKHPELFLPSGKEAPFFSHDTNWNEGWSEYVRHHFALATESKRWGTVTPHYMYGSLCEAASPDELAAVSRPERLVPERIASHSPNARLIAILRDPVDRAYSHYRMERFREAESRTFEEAIDFLLEPRQLEQSRRQPDEVAAYVTNGEYGRILTPYFELFGKDRILVCFASDLASEPRQRSLSPAVPRRLDRLSTSEPRTVVPGRRQPPAVPAARPEPPRAARGRQPAASPDLARTAGRFARADRSGLQGAEVPDGRSQPGSGARPG